MKLPFQPYRGKDPYVFVSYAHEDAQPVYDEIAWLHDQGLNIWYDQHIGAGAAWQDTVADQISACHCFLAFLSPAYVASANCVNELHYSQGQGNPFIGVYLDPVALTPGLELSIGSRQTLRRDVDSSWRTRLLQGLGEHVQHHIRTLRDQIIVFADLRRFGRFERERSLADLEALLLRYDLLNHEICNEFGGTVRHFGGDDCCLTFPQVDRALSGVRELLRRWHGFLAQTGYDVPLAVGVSAGNLMMFRSFVFGTDTARRLCGRIRQEGDSSSRVLIGQELARTLPEELITPLPDEEGREPACEIRWRE